MTTHVTVLKDQSIEYLITNKKGSYLDCTLGGGGHTLAILEALDGGKLVSIDSDLNAVNNFKHQFKNLSVLNLNFANLQSQNLGKFDGILADLGWSTDQLESVPGLSFKQDNSVLDMRLDKSLQVMAADILNLWPPQVLTQVFMQNANVGFLQTAKLTKQIASTRQIKAYKTVADLNSTLINLGFNTSAITKVYQALRIAVNHELSALQSLINYAEQNLVHGGRLVVVTFHSKEEEVITNTVKQSITFSYVLPKKYIQPSVAELTKNIRSRSAKLWILSANGKTKSK